MPDDFNKLIHIERDTPIGSSSGEWFLINRQVVDAEQRNYYVAPEPRRAIVVCRHGRTLDEFRGKTVVCCLHPKRKKGPGLNAMKLRRKSLV